MTRQLAAALVIGAGLARAALAADSSAVFEGGWTGGYALGAVPVSVAIRFRAAGVSLSGVLRPQVPAGDTMAVRVEVADAERVSFTAGDGDSALSFGGRLSGSVLTGVVTQQGRRGDFELVRTVPITSEHLGDYVGYYDEDGGKTVVIGRSLGQLYYLEPEAGRQGALFAVSKESFVGGALTPSSTRHLHKVRLKSLEGRHGAGSTGFGWPSVVHRRVQAHADRSDPEGRDHGLGVES